MLELLQYKRSGSLKIFDFLARVSFFFFFWGGDLPVHINNPALYSSWTSDKWTSF